jgi:hypothetical protein
LNLYWGDVHNHCGVTYGFGSLENAIAAARTQLDFCAVIGHAMWPDMPERTAGLEFLVDFHRNGFAKLRQNWDYVRRTVQEANVPHEFVTFQGYEMHSREFGDHHFLSPSDELPIFEAASPAELVARLAPLPVIAVPHHVGYTPGHRGTNWAAFQQRNSPVVEVYSKHGASISDQSLYPYYHDMGPRDSRNTIHYALKQGLRFGFVGSTDHHAGYPGSHGDGRVAVLAQARTRDAIWEALLARRTYAVTGDKIQCRFTVNGACCGSDIVDSGRRNIELDIRACDTIDKITIYKNGSPWKIENGRTPQDPGNGKKGKYKIRIESGWQRTQGGHLWEGTANISNGQLLGVETCFRGQSVLAPSPGMEDDPQINGMTNKLIEQSGGKAVWLCTSFKNISTLHPQTAAVILEIEGSPQSMLDVNLNGAKQRLSMGELAAGSRSVHLPGYGTPAYLIHRAVPEAEYTFHGQWTDDAQESECDEYHVEIRQMNGQCAWISPVFINH